MRHASCCLCDDDSQARCASVELRDDPDGGLRVGRHDERMHGEPGSTLCASFERGTGNDATLRRDHDVGKKRVTDHQVKRLAHGIAATQIAAQTRLRARLSELGIEPARGPFSEQVRRDVGSDLDALPSASGQGLDRAYVDGQLGDLTRAAELLGRITGHLRDPGLAEALQWLASGLDADIRGAQSLRDSLQEGTTNRRPDAYDPDKSSR